MPDQEISGTDGAGRHPEFGRLTILRQAAYLAYHEQTHLPEIEAVRPGEKWNRSSNERTA